MSVNIEKIIEIIEECAPVNLKEDWDNVGLLVGSGNGNIDKILIALDLTDEVIEEAINIKAGLIITHHPAIFKPILRVCDTTPLGRRIIMLIKNNIAVYSAHTNLDCAQGGTNDVLFDAIGLVNKEALFDPKSEAYPFGMGRVGELPASMKLRDFAQHVKKSINSSDIRYVGRGDTEVMKVGLCTGSSASFEFFMKAKDKGCHVYVTGDISYHMGQTAEDMGLCLVDATHYYSEIIVVKAVKERLDETFKAKGISVLVAESKTDHQVLNPWINDLEKGL